MALLSASLFMIDDVRTLIGVADLSTSTSTSMMSVPAERGGDAHGPGSSPQAI
jgi:hypothetical protein